MPADDDSKFSSKILECVKLGKIDELEQMVKRGASINEVDKSRDQFTPLHCAAYYGSLECLHWLLWKGADTTMATPKGWTTAHIAAIRGQYACLQALIQSGVNINVKDHRGQTTAHLASTHGHSHTLQALLRGGADINIQDSNGWTPVHTAAYHGRLGCLQFLKTAGGKLDECDNEGNTPVHLAAMEGHLHCLKYLLSNIRGMGSILNGRNDQGDTPKTLAEQFFKSQIVEYLDAVEWERDHPEQAENLSFPAHIAAFNGDLNHLKLLVEQGVISINERDDKGCTPAHKAAGQGHLHILQWLIENGANVNIKNNSDETPRDVAQRFAQLACSKLLESETADERDNRNGEKRIELEDDEEKPKDSTRLTHEQKKQAKLRAKKKVEEIERLLEIARSNYLQLGGKLEDVQNKMLTREQTQLKEYERTIAELENELECERLRREKLEAQLDACRQEIEKSVKTLRDYEAKVNIMERYIHTMKLDPNGRTDNKKKKKVIKSPKKEIKTEIYYQSPGSNSSFHQSKKSAEEPSKDFYSDESYSNMEKEFGHLNIMTSELMQLKLKFEKYDKKKNGFISADDLDKLYEDLGIEVDKDEIDEIIENLETDGKISHNDFIETTSRRFLKHKSKELTKDSRKGSIISNSSAQSKKSVKGTFSQDLYSDESHDKIDKEFEHLNLPKPQLLQLKLAFEGFDKKKNGFVDDKDLKKIYEDLSIDVDEDDLEELIDTIEKDGKISFKVFIETTAKQFFKKFTKEEIKEAFKKIDKNNSGCISQEELRAVLSKKGKLYSKEEIAKLVDSVDKNKDGLISIEEFSKLVNN